MTFCVSVYSQDLTSFITSLQNTAEANRQARVDSFFGVNNFYPLVQDDTVCYFLIKTNSTSVAMAGDVNGWDGEADPLNNIRGTDMWYLKHTYPSDARLEYKFVLDGSAWELDARNKNKQIGGFGYNSVVFMPDYEIPWEIENRPTVPKGKVEKFDVYSTEMDKTYEVQVYTPANYTRQRRYATAYFHDGHEYLSFANTNVILDNLIDSGMIDPIIGVFVKPTDRNNEYAFDKKEGYTNFFCNELVPWVEDRWASERDSSKRATIGASFGGNISMYICMSRPDVFYMTGQQSGAWWPEDFKVVKLYGDGIYTDIPMKAVWGSFEGGLTQLWRTMRDSLPKYGFENTYFKEHNEGHSWGFWQSSLDEILVELFPPGTVSGVEESRLKNHVTVYPNPATDRLFLKDMSQVTEVRIYDLKGRVLVNLNEYLEQGIDISHLPAGKYFLRFSSKGKNGLQTFIKSGIGK
jgi:enterochelin esterase-like enzyme